MRDVTAREVATLSNGNRVALGFWARFWEGLRNSLAAVCV